MRPRAGQSKRPNQPDSAGTKRPGGRGHLCIALRQRSFSTEADRRSCHLHSFVLPTFVSSRAALPPNFECLGGVARYCSTTRAASIEWRRAIQPVYTALPPAVPPHEGRISSTILSQWGLESPPTCGLQAMSLECLLHQRCHSVPTYHRRGQVRCRPRSLHSMHSQCTRASSPSDSKSRMKRAGG